MGSSELISAVNQGALPWREVNPHYRIAEASRKRYPAQRFVVQSSQTPISLGQPMLPLMETQAFRDYLEAQRLPLAPDFALEVYLYNWVEKAQGPMIFDVGYAVGPDFELPEGAPYLVKEYPAVEVSSIVYEGPFPYQEMSGWGHIEWEARAAEQGWRYTERLYRELYHHYDFDKNRNIVEIQIEVEA